MELLNSVYIDGGILIGAGADQLMASSDGKGVVNSVKNSVFDGLSSHFNDYGISFFGNTNGGQVRGICFGFAGNPVARP